MQVYFKIIQLVKLHEVKFSYILTYLLDNKEGYGSKIDLKAHANSVSLSFM